MTRAESWAVRVSTTLYGFALGVAIAPSLQRPASAGDLPSALKTAGYAPAWLFVTFGVLLALTAVGGLVGCWVARLLSGWAAVCFSIALATAPITLMHYGNLRHVALHGLAAAIVLLWRAGALAGGGAGAPLRSPRFSREDVVLIPVLLSCYMAFLDTGFGKTQEATFLRAAIVVFALRLIVGVVATIERPALAFAIAPLALVAQMQWIKPWLGAAIALLILLLTPFHLARLADDRQLARMLRNVVYPIVAVAYPLALLGINAPPHVNFFEDGHDIPVAGEMLRGERPYRDIIPMHSFVADGALSWAAMKLGAHSIGAALTVRQIVAALNMAAVYFLAFAATGSAEGALLAVFLAFCMFPAQTVWLRPAGAIFALGCIATATRLRSRRWFTIAGASMVVAFLVGIEFGLCSILVGLVAAIRSRAMRPLLVGIAITLVPLGLWFDFFRVTALEILGNRSAYFIRPLEIPASLHSLGAMVDTLGDSRSLAILTWMIALIASTAALACSPLRARRGDGVWYIGAWIVLAGGSYVDRQNVYFAAAGAAFIVAAILVVWRHARTPAIVLIVIVALLAKPFVHVMSVVPPLRENRGVAIGNGAFYRGSPRAGNAVFDQATIPALDAAKRFLTAMPPDETFVDFANAAMLYYLFDRDCPLRQTQVGLYESESAQREVIARIERNPKVTAALIAFPGGDSNIDGVPNRNRAPLVWTYLQQHFTPAFDEHGVVFWKRTR